VTIDIHNLTVSLQFIAELSGWAGLEEEKSVTGFMGEVKKYR